MKHIHTITLSAAKGTQTIARAAEVFSYIDSDFENWGTDKKGEKKEEMDLAVCELSEDMTFKQIFAKPEEMCLSQAQIIELCQSHKDKLRQDGYSTFFLFKVGTEFFVARVRVRSDARLEVYVFRFSHDRVWDAEFRRRFVLPQLALKHLALETLSPSEPLAPEILELKVKVGENIITFIPKA